MVGHDLGGRPENSSLVTVFMCLTLFCRGALLSRRYFVVALFCRCAHIAALFCRALICRALKCRRFIGDKDALL
jgi:hypothetical protein